MNNQNVAIRVSNVTKLYKLYEKNGDRLKEAVRFFSSRKYHTDFYALNGVSFDIPYGQTVALVGKNGSGKSTLLKLITGVLTPTSGLIEVNGKISALLELGTGFNQELTGIENIFLYGTIMGFSRKEMENKVESILNFADIGDFAQQPVKMYSSGMFARLAFAVSINVDADILIVDEALAVGDIAFQFKCYKKFNELKKAGKTIIFVTHSMDSVLRYCDHVIVINNGLKVTEGPPKEMVDVYKKILVDSYGSQFDQVDEGGYLKSEGLLNEAGSKRWKDLFPVNPESLDYGNKQAEIVDYALFDDNGQPLTNIPSDETIHIMMKVKFHEPIRDPIFAFTIKDLKGYELAGTNTLYEHIDMKAIKRQDEVTVHFTQKLNFQAGDYTLSLGCTGFAGDEFVVHHRLYDIVIFKVLLNRNIVGLFNLNSTVKVEVKST